MTRGRRDARIGARVTGPFGVPGHGVPTGPSGCQSGVHTGHEDADQASRCDFADANYGVPTGPCGCQSGVHTGHADADQTSRCDCADANYGVPTEPSGCRSGVRMGAGRACSEGPVGHFSGLRRAQKNEYLYRFQMDDPVRAKGGCPRKKRASPASVDRPRTDKPSRQRHIKVAGSGGPGGACKQNNAAIEAHIGCRDPTIRAASMNGKTLG